MPYDAEYLHQYSQKIFSFFFFLFLPLDFSCTDIYENVIFA